MKSVLHFIFNLILAIYFLTFAVQDSSIVVSIKLTRDNIDKGTKNEAILIVKTILYNFKR